MTQPAGAVIVSESQWARVESQFIWRCRAAAAGFVSRRRDVYSHLCK